MELHPPARHDRADEELLCQWTVVSITSTIVNTMFANATCRLSSQENATACYMQAFMAPISWMILTAQDKNNTDMNALNMDDFDTLLWSAKDALRDLPSSAFKFPPKVELEKMKRL